MSFDYSQKVESISSKTQLFGLETGANIAKLRGRNVSIPDVEGLHNRVYGIFQTTMNEINAIKLDIQSKTTFANQDQMLGIVTLITGFETRLLEELNTFNDTVLTYCPTAKINYGIPCIGPKIVPQIKTSNQKILAVLAKCPCIREIRGDGNCFLSAFTTRLLENLVEKKEIDRFVEFIMRDGVDASELKAELVTTLLHLQEYPSQLENILKDNHKTLPFINYFRQLAAAEMKKHKTDFEVFFSADLEQIYQVATVGQSYENLVDQYVLKMGVDFSHPMITALCRKLDFPVCIIDPKIGANQGVNVLDQNDAAGTFCRIDSHYFVLYPPAEGITIPVAPLQQPRIDIPLSQSNETIIKCKVPFGHTLFIRGSSNGLSWDKGNPLIPIDEENWLYRSNAPLQDMEYKFLIDDSIWQENNNFKASNGKLSGTTPDFKIPATMNTDFLDHPVPTIPVAPIQQPRIDIPLPQSTETIIKCKVPFGHNLFIRGSGNGLNWEKGTPLVQIDDENWLYRSNAPLQDMEYKFLIDDSIWQEDNNFKASNGKLDGATPHFNIPASVGNPVPATRVTVKFNPGSGNKLFIRGNGPGMSWEKGAELRHVGNDIWIYETQANFQNFEYKIVLNDQKWEDCDNHKMDCGKKEQIVPKF